MKFDTSPDKLRWDLLPIEEVEEIVQILSYGSEKYADNNWQLVENGKERYYAAMMRHLVSWRKGKQRDDESNLNHLAHAACNLLFLMWLDNHREEAV